MSGQQDNNKHTQQMQQQQLCPDRMTDDSKRALPVRPCSAQFKRRRKCRGERSPSESARSRNPSRDKCSDELDLANRQQAQQSRATGREKRNGNKTSARKLFSQPKSSPTPKLILSNVLILFPMIVHHLLLFHSIQCDSLKSATSSTRAALATQGE